MLSRAMPGAARRTQALAGSAQGNKASMSATVAAPGSAVKTRRR